MDRQNKEMLRIFFFVIAGLSIMGASVLYGLYFIHTLHIEDKIKSDSIVFDNQIKNKIDEKARTYFSLMEIFQKDEDLITAYQRNDRTAFFEKAKTLYENLNEHFETTHFYVHHTDKINFIRLHNPEEHSDLITRYTLEMSEKNNTEFYGVEFGMKNNLSLRAVKPWIVEGRLIGYLELGEEIGYMFPSVSKQLGVQLILSINKELVNEKELQEWLQNIIDPDRNIIEAKNYLIIYSSEGSVNPEIMAHIDSDNLNAIEEFVYGDTFSVKSSTFFDVRGQEIGKITIIRNIEKEVSYRNQLIISVGLFGVAVSSFMLLLLWHYLKRMQNQINTSYEQIQELSIRDGMTGLYNRRYFDTTASQLNKQAKRMDKKISFTILDIDCFKRYNDTYGHIKGDEVIKEIANSIKHVYKRETDYIFRMGGEEYAVLCLDSNEDHAKRLAEKLREEVENMKIVHCDDYDCEYITVSIGVAVHEEFKSVDDLYKIGDKALYQAKEGGRNRVVVYGK